MEQNDLQSVTENSHHMSQKSGKDNDDSDMIDRNTQSRATSNRNDPDKVWTTEEILADEDLWKVSDSSEESSSEEEKKESKTDSKHQSQKAEAVAEGADGSKSIAEGAKQNQSVLSGEEPPVKKAKPTPYNAYERNKDYYDNEVELEDELEKMARYLVDKAPQME